MSSSLAELDATGQAALVRRGEASAIELVAGAVERIESVDAELGAVPIRSFERALEAAVRVDLEADFAGVPFLLKDVGARQEGHPYYAGNRALRAADHRAAADTPLGARFKELGLVTLGSSNAPEFGLQSNTWPLVHGPTRNPWDPGRCAGGSSGGACAAVAAGLVPVAHGSDGAGSIRIPAAWCGLVGLKPTRDRIAWRHAGQDRPDVEFVVARSLRDTVAFLDLLRRESDRGASPRAFRDALEAERGELTRRDFTLRFPTGLRVGFTTRSPAGVAVDSRTRLAVERTARSLEQVGCAVDEVAPPALFAYEERSLYGAVLGPLEYRACLADLANRLGREVVADDVEPFLWELAHPAETSISADDVARARAFARDWTRQMLAWFEEFDLLVTPTVHEPAPELGVLDPSRSQPLELLEHMVGHMSFTEPWNATGQPAISIPLGGTDRGLPIGVQLVAARWREDLLLRISAHLLAEHEPKVRRPRIHA